MTINLQVILRGDYAEISCRGIYSKDALLDALDRALDIGEKEGVATVVLDIDTIILKGPLPGIMERYYLGEMAAKIQLRHRKRIFLAVVGKEPLIDPERFAETVAINRGAHGKVFAEMKEARRWIKDRTSDKSTS